MGGFVTHPRPGPGSMPVKSSIARAVSSIQGIGDKRETEVFVLSLVVPWLTLLVVAEPGRTERFFWLWPLQAIVLAAFVTRVMARWRATSLVLWLSHVLLIGTMLINPLQLHLEPWLREGWAGSDPEEVQVVDYVAQQLRSNGRDHAAIGYQLFIYEFMAQYNIMDPQYKVGAEFDLLFKYRQGIGNTDQCAEGVSSPDEYRIVQTRPKSGEAEPRQYVDVPLDKRFRSVRSFDLYQVFKRDGENAGDVSR
jgi:hypothetical protein